MEEGSVRPKREGFAWMVHGLHHAHLHILKYLMIPQFLELKARLLLSLGPKKVPELRPNHTTPSQPRIYAYMPKLFFPEWGEELAMFMAA